MSRNQAPLALAWILFLLLACDSPTLPENGDPFQPEDRPRGAEASYAGDECEDPDWDWVSMCQEDDNGHEEDEDGGAGCVEACGSNDSDSGGTSSGGGSPSGSIVHLDLAVHEVVQDTLDCNNPPSGASDYVKAVANACREAQRPSLSQKSELRVALNAISSVPGCEELAAFGHSLLDQNEIHVFPHSAGIYGSGQALGGVVVPGHPVFLSDVWFGGTVVRPAGHDLHLTLRYAIVHELEHRQGLNHLEGSDFELSSSTFRCGGVSR